MPSVRTWLLDRNKNGISDVWAQQFNLFHPVTGEPAVFSLYSEVAALRPEGDYDQDGQSNWEEFVFGTDPSQKFRGLASNLPPTTYEINAERVVLNSDFIIKAYGFMGKKLQLQHSYDLGTYDAYNVLRLVFIILAFS